MQGSHEKTVNKSKCWSKHGKHKTILGQIRRQEREQKAQRGAHKPEMVDSIQELFKKKRR